MFKFYENVTQTIVFAKKCWTQEAIPKKFYIQSHIIYKSILFQNSNCDLLDSSSTAGYVKAKSNRTKFEISIKTTGLRHKNNIIKESE